MFEVNKGATQPYQKRKKTKRQIQDCYVQIYQWNRSVYSYKLHINYALMVLGLTPIFLQETLGIICFVSTRSLYLMVKLSNES